MLQTFVIAFAGLLAVHWFFDFPGQGQFLSDIKNKQVPVFPWWYGLTAHSMIQAAATYGMVWMFSPELAFQLALFEFIAHWLIDWIRVEKKVSAMGDQLAHLACKLLYAFFITFAHTHIDVWLRPM